VLRTAHSVSPVSAQQAGVSLLVFVIVYFVVFGTGIYYMLKLMKHGPVSHGELTQSRGHPGLRNRALDVLKRE
jgi:cytochrome d ubiquinol oxidase subunit I